MLYYSFRGKSNRLFSWLKIMSRLRFRMESPWFDLWEYVNSFY